MMQVILVNPEPLLPLELAYLAGILRDKYPAQNIDLNISGFDFTALIWVRIGQRTGLEKHQRESGPRADNRDN